MRVVLGTGARGGRSGRPSSRPSIGGPACGSRRRSRSAPRDVPLPGRSLRALPLLRRSATRAGTRDDHLVRVASIRRDQIERLDARRDHDARGARRHARRHGRPAHVGRDVRDAPPPGLAPARRSAHRNAPLRAARAGGAPRPRAPPGSVAGRPLLRHRGRPVLGARPRARVPARDHRRGRPLHRDLGARPRRGAASRSSACIGLFHERLAAHPDMHVYHYAAYETTALKRLTAEHGILEDELDELLRRETFVDLYTVTRQALRISYPSYSIKKVREFFMEATAELEGGDDAIVALRAVGGRARPGDPRRDRASTTRRTASRTCSCATGCSSGGRRRRRSSASRSRGGPSPR